MKADLAAGEALRELGRQTGAQFPNLAAARAKTEALLVERRAAVSEIALLSWSNLDVAPETRTPRLSIALTANKSNVFCSSS